MGKALDQMLAENHRRWLNGQELPWFYLTPAGYAEDWAAIKRTKRQWKTMSKASMTKKSYVSEDMKKVDISGA